MTAIEQVKVGNVLELARREVSIDPLTEYRLIGIYSFGKGIFHREPAMGSELGAYRFFEIRPGDLVLSNIQAWEGAIGYATDADSETVGTHRFLSYVPISNRINANWARWFFLSEPGMELIRRAAPGTSMRNRTLAIRRFEALDIPLPPIDKQLRTAAQLDAIRARTTATFHAQKKGQQIDKAMIDATIAQIIRRGRDSGWPVTRLDRVAEVNPRGARLAPDELISFIPMAAVSKWTGSIDIVDLRNAGALSDGYKQFKLGDVIFARITPCMQNGKTAVFDGRTTYGYGSTEFHVIRPKPAVSASWVHRFLRTQEFRNSAARHLTGTAGQQRLSADFLRAARIPIPPNQTEVVATIDRLLDAGSKLRGRREQAAELTAAIEPSVINQAFSEFDQ